MSPPPGVGIRELAEQDPGRGYQLFKGEGPTHEQARKTELREHHPVQQADKNHGQTADAPLKQTQAQQAGEWERQLDGFS